MSTCTRPASIAGEPTRVGKLQEACSRRSVTRQGRERSTAVESFCRLDSDSHTVPPHFPSRDKCPRRSNCPFSHTDPPEVEVYYWQYVKPLGARYVPRPQHEGRPIVRDNEDDPFVSELRSTCTDLAVLCLALFHKTRADDCSY